MTQTLEEKNIEYEKNWKIFRKELIRRIELEVKVRNRKK